MKHVSTADLCNPEADRSTRRLRRVPDFLPVRLQDLLHRGKPEVRARKVIALQMKSCKARLSGAPCSLYIGGNNKMIHRYQKKGLNFVLDVNSGAVHLLDDISYAVSGLLDENMA